MPDLGGVVPDLGGVVSGHQSTCLPNRICMKSNTKERAPVAEGLPEETNAIGDSKKTTETEAKLITQSQTVSENKINNTASK